MARNETLTNPETERLTALGYDSSFRRRISFRYWLNSHQARLFLTAVMLLITVSPIADLWSDGDLLMAPVVVLVVIAAIYHSRAGRLMFFITSMLAFAWFLSLSSSNLFHVGAPCSGAIMLALNVVMLLMMGRRFIGAKQIDLETMSAAFSGYLLIAAIWSKIYFLIIQIDPSAFVVGNSTHLNSSTLLYFSLQTLTTLGLGDILPVDPFVRMLVVNEAIIGQFYIATVIARLATLPKP